jgi:hypothetical protein
LPEYLGSRDFVNFRSSTFGIRPLYNVSTAGDLIRFVFKPNDPANPNVVTRIFEFGVPVSLINLNSFSSSTAVEVAKAALNRFRPDPSRADIQQLVSAGNSFYHGVTFELRKRFKQTKNFALSFRLCLYLFSFD